MVERRLLAPRTGVLLLVVVMFATSVALWLVDDRRLPLPAGAPRLHWWLLAPLFAVVEVVVLHVQIRREAQTISLNEIPLCLALFFATPGDMLLAAVLGSGAMYVFYRRQTLIKAIFNITLRAFGVTLTLALAHLLDGTPSPDSPRSWLAAIAALAVAGAADGLVVLAVVGIHDGTVHRPDVLRELLRYPPIAALVATTGVLAAATLHANPRTAPLLAIVAVALFAAYQAHTALNDQHLSLARIYAVGRLITATHDQETIVSGVLAGARDLLGAKTAELVLLGGERQESIRRWTSSGNPPELRIDDVGINGFGINDHPAIWGPVLSGGEPLLAARKGRDHPADGKLRRLGYREAVIVPLKADSGVIGTLMVADRVGEVRTFHPEEIPALETIATQAALALTNARLLERLRHEAMHDVLTGLPNRAAFRAAVEAALADLAAPAARAGDQFAVLLLDLNGFKDVNDSLGHQAGDRLLIHVAHGLSRVINPPAIAARLGGDEFAILLPAADPALAESLADTIHHDLAEPLTIDSIDVQVRTSIGIAFAPDHGGSTTDLLLAADTAMYAAKIGNGRTATYRSEQPGVLAQSRQASLADSTLARVAELRKAVTERELTIDVQPQARTDTGEIVGVESLIRWDHPRHGLIPPADIFRLADRHGLTHDLSELILDAALRAAASWRSLNIELPIAVNISASSLLDPRLPGSVAAALNRHRLHPSSLTLEITEESAMNDPEGTLSVLAALRDTGIRLSVDDFGTGYSSLTYLSRLPVHEVKIDRCFVASIVRDAHDLIITRSIIDLGTNLGLDVIAEGVEDRDTWNKLADLGCDAVQGFYLAKPMPAEDLPAWLRRYNEHRRAPALPGPGRQRAGKLPTV
jgi:diguanylate cyclase (GGDEF)-like protein